MNGALELPLNEWLSATFYVSNFAPISSWEVGHTWSLAVEEQFYLLMPSLLFFGKRRAFFILCAVVLLCPFFRLGTFALFPDPDLRWVGYGFQANADSLAVGGFTEFSSTKILEKHFLSKISAI